MKIHRADYKREDVEAYLFWCPGCECAHQIVVRAPDGWGTANGKGGARWTYDGNVESPTIQPSVLCFRGGQTRCHLWVKAGMIEFLPDSHHKLAGTTVPMQDL